MYNFASTIKQAFPQPEKEAEIEEGIEEQIAAFVKKKVAQGKIGFTWDYEEDNKELVDLIVKISQKQN
jgi:hypothetical protein